MFPGFKERLERELRMLAPDTMEVSHPDIRFNLPFVYPVGFSKASEYFDQEVIFKILKNLIRDGYCGLHIGRISG